MKSNSLEKRMGSWENLLLLFGNPDWRVFLVNNEQRDQEKKHSQFDTLNFFYC